MKLLQISNNEAELLDNASCHRGRQHNRLLHKNLSKKTQKDGLDNVLSKSLRPHPKDVFAEYWLLKNEAFGIKFEGSFEDDRRIDKESPKKINDIAEKLLREICSRSGIFYKDIHAYWRMCWDEFSHPHLHLTILLRGLHKSKPQLIKMAKTAKRVWHLQNAANCKSEVFKKEKGTRQMVHSYALRKNEGIDNRLGMTPRLYRFLIRKSDTWSMENEPIQLFQKSSSEPRRGSNSFTNRPAGSAHILEVDQPFFAKSTSRNGFKKGKIRVLWDKMAHFLKKIVPK
jgi:hypothetical protein